MKRHTPIVVVAVLLAALCGGGLVRAMSSGASQHWISVPSSIDATGRVDVSNQMAAFFASVPDGGLIQFPKGARYHMDQTLVLANRHHLFIEGNGAQFFATSTGDRDRANVRIIDSDSIIVHALVVRGANPNAGLSDAAWVVALEAQHGFDIDGSSNVGLFGVTATDVYGDFVYVGGSAQSGWSNRVFVLDSHFARNGRQGFTITAAQHVDIERNTVSDTRRATIDFEPNGADSGASDITIKNNAFNNGRMIFLSANGKAPADNVNISGNTLHGLTFQAWVENTVAGNRNNWTMTNNTSDMTLANPTGAAMRITRVNGLQVSGNYQRYSVGRNMVTAKITDSCNYMVGGNVRPGSVGEFRATGSC